MNVDTPLFTTLVPAVPSTYQVTVVPAGMNQFHKSEFRVQEVPLPE